MSPGRPRIGLALGGGGAKGLAHVGVLRVLAQAGIPIDLLAGVSMGAVVAAAFGLDEGQPDDRVIGSLRRLGLDALPSLTPRHDAGRRWGRLRRAVEVERFLVDNLVWPAMVADAKVEAFLAELTAGRRLEEGRVPVAVVACDLISGREAVFREGPATYALRASTALPGIFPPVAHNGQLLIDGGFAGMVPTGVVRAMGADLVVAVDADPLPVAGRIHNGLETLLRALEICSQRHKAWLLREADFVIRVEFDEPVGALDFSRSHQCVEAGARAGRQALPTLRALVDRPPPPRRPLSDSIGSRLARWRRVIAWAPPPASTSEPSGGEPAIGGSAR